MLGQAGAQNSVAVVVLPDFDGIEVLTRVQRIDRDVPIERRRLGRATEPGQAVSHHPAKLGGGQFKVLPDRCRDLDRL
jgi:hypothetical protein